MHLPLNRVITSKMLGLEFISTQAFTSHPHLHLCPRSYPHPTTLAFQRNSIQHSPSIPTLLTHTTWGRTQDLTDSPHSLVTPQKPSNDPGAHVNERWLGVHTSECHSGPHPSEHHPGVHTSEHRPGTHTNGCHLGPPGHTSECRLRSHINERQPGPVPNIHTAHRTTTGLTGGKGQYTHWVHCELIVGSETIRPAHTQRVNSGHIQKVPTHLPSPNPGGKQWAHLKSTHQFVQRNTQQVHISHFQKVPTSSPGSYPAGKWWALLQSTQHNTQWVLFEQTHFVLSQSVHNVPRGYFVKEPFEFFHNVPINLIKMCPTGTLRVL